MTKSFSAARRLGLITSLTLAYAAPHHALAKALPELPLELTREVGPLAHDPWEGLNRKTFKFNQGLDRVLIGPIGRGYMKVTPRVVRGRVSSFVANLAEPRTAINDLAQGRPRAASVTASRFLINTTVGGLGLFDVGGKLGLEGHRGDFGQTLGRYGAGSGRYLVLPLMGPTTLRDGIGQLVDMMTDPVAMATAGGPKMFGAIRSSATMLDGRANADGFLRALDDAADPYAMMRSVYLQNRADMVRQARGGAQVLPDFDAAKIEP
ncbi:VacJ family lipoprotein [Caulobacter segnis]|uniref:VacJ family lipoprotein n=2 Tax=Caulobacter segnis TaxID=88688 RepID=D5VK81_CAUST|nr:VacJ family lipoprotein [Caulobacter segnis]ADG10904.1 VacJ family lipoprotein [Caulobacter segnis ATCC 21756]AVQ02602.1 VacJ family lipoprotein [Caulobacter segnis]